MLITKEMFIHCSTYEEVVSLFENIGQNPCAAFLWYTYQKNTCIHVIPKKSYINWEYNSVGYYKISGKEIIEFSELTRIIP